MDKKTLDVYGESAETFSREWSEQPIPLDIHALVEKYFIRNGQTVDIGCGNGRDAQWLNQNGFPCRGFDAVEAFVQLASAQFPSIPFGLAKLPKLGVCRLIAKINIDV